MDGSPCRSRFVGRSRLRAIQLDLQRVINEGVLKELKKEGTKSLLKKLLGR